MADTGAHSPDSIDRWWLLTRRALNLPDVMTDKSARAAVVGRLASEFEGGTLPEESALTLAEALLDGYLEMGAAGELDDLFVDDGAMMEGLLGVGVGGGRIGERVTTAQGVRGTAATRQRAAEALQWLVDQVEDFAKNNPTNT